MESIVTLLQLLQILSTKSGNNGFLPDYARNRGILFGYLSLFDYLCTSKIQKTPLTMSQKEQKKWEEMICLTTDHEVEEMLRTLEYNWDTAASRMEQITHDRQLGLYDDSGVEAMAVFNRMERVGTLLFALYSRPQALLLSGFRSLLSRMNADHRMDAEIASLISPRKGREMVIDAPTIWKRIQETYERNTPSRQNDGAMLRKLFKDHYIPNMDDEDTMGWMTELVKLTPEDQEKLEFVNQMIDSMVYLSENLGKALSGSRQQIGMGLMMMQQAMETISQYADLGQMSNESADALFEEAKQELMKSEAWRTYWRDHVAHLSLMGENQLAEQLKADAEEVEQQLLDLHGYIYNKWDESADAFGAALKESHLSDDEMLRLIFLLAKKEMLEKEGDLPDSHLLKMRNNVLEWAAKLDVLCSEKYYAHYEEIWQDIVQNPIIGAQLSEYRNGKHNKGFNMQCFCHIIGWLMREKQFFETDSPAELARVLGDKYSKDTFKDYIKKTNIVLTAQSVFELESIINHYKSEK